MDSVIYRLFYHEFQSNKNKDLQNKQFFEKYESIYQIVWDCLRELDEGTQNKVLGELRKFAAEATGDHAEYFAEGFCMGAKLMIEVLTAI